VRVVAFFTDGQQGGFSLREKILRENVTPEGTLLHLATKLEMQDVVRALLMAGADPTVENKNGENAFELATSDSIQQVYVEELLRATAGSEYVLRIYDEALRVPF
jgi:ankyrin repeat protein